MQVISQVNTILFNLLVLRGISDSRGKVWRCHPNQLYVVEITMPNYTNDSFDKNDPEYLTLSMLEMFPLVSCLKPQEALSKLKLQQTCKLSLC